jgi:FtsZ-interacting cell division protein ZipA
MSSGAIIIIIVVAVVVIAVIVGGAMAQRRMRLQRKYGPEYDRVASQQRSKMRADSELAEREKRVRGLDIRPLSEESRRRYRADWVAVQERFVDAPREAVTEAYALVTTVMKEQGYPAEDYDQVADDLSVRHPQMLPHFRAAHEISLSAADDSADTEELRRAVIYYRDLFTDLLGDPAVQAGNGTAALSRPGPTSGDPEVLPNAQPAAADIEPPERTVQPERGSAP